MGGKHSKAFIKKVDERDLVKIKLVFNDLSAASAGKGIDIETFKQFANLTDLIADRAFVLFAQKKPTLIDLEEFAGGLALCHRGSEKDKIKVIFKIFSVGGDKITKEDVSTILMSAVNSPAWNPTTREDLKRPTEPVQKLIEMGFPRHLCEKAVEATKSNNVDDAVAWILSNKPDPQADALIILQSIFEGHSDGHTNWKKFKKWATSHKRPPQFVGLLNWFPLLYERAILYSSAPPAAAGAAGGAPHAADKPFESLIDMSFEEKPAPVPETKTKRRSLSLLGRGKSIPTPAAPPPVQNNILTEDMVFLQDITLTPVSTPTLNLNPMQRSGSFQEPVASPALAPATPPLPRLPSQAGTPATPPPPRLNLFAPPPAVLPSGATTPTSVPPPPSTAAPHTLTLTPPAGSISSLSLTLSPATATPSHSLPISSPSALASAPIGAPAGAPTSARAGSPSPATNSPGARTRASTTLGPTQLKRSNSSVSSSSLDLEDGARSRSGTLGKKAGTNSTTSTDDWSSDEDEQEMRPAIQVIIKDKAASNESALPADLKKAVSEISLAIPKAKPRGHGTVGSRRSGRVSQKFSLESSFFENAPATDSAESTPEKAPPNNRNSMTPEPGASSREWLATTPPPLPSALASTSAPTLITTPTQPPPPPPPQTATETADHDTKHNTSAASEYLKTAMAHLEKGSFQESLQDVDKSLNALVESPAPLAVKGEANFCVAYKIALGLLLAIREIETKMARDPAAPNTDMHIRMAFLSKILSDIPLKATHRIVCVRMAISKNMHPLVGNWAVAARLVEALLLKGAPDREALQTKLKKCKEVCVDNNLPPYTCPHCNQATSSSGLKCTSCQRPIRWCFKTFDLITTKNYLQCNYCNAMLAPHAANMLETCEFCKYGTLEHRE